MVDYTKPIAETKNFIILDRYTNEWQVCERSQTYQSEAGTQANRYDVTVLVNGLPLVQIELKKRGVAIREAFNQVRRYSKESFNTDNSLNESAQPAIQNQKTKRFSKDCRFC